VRREPLAYTESSSVIATSRWLSPTIASHTSRRWCGPLTIRSSCSMSACSTMVCSGFLIWCRMRAVAVPMAASFSSSTRRRSLRRSRVMITAPVNTTTLITTIIVTE
jgi:hypothetical protein